LVSSPPFDEDEAIQTSIIPAHEDNEVVSCTPFQVFDSYDASSCDFESDGLLEEPLDVLVPHFDDKSEDAIENIDDFIYIGRHISDISFFFFDGDPIYDIESCFQIKNIEFFPL
jgi:hypothetical protein